ncbi:phage tail sheath family protein [Streptomyces noursei]|uniref:phage tail sheath family protein n=1 Tax=Streptomyces noursei TaxID=1971 RepID=UPI0015E0F51E|nr:phage tail sheath subtilisin-like domain-containing protein [Streptomyces noursei]
MNTLPAPGIYAKEASVGTQSAIGASTSTPAFLGNTVTFDTLRPTLIHNWIDFRKKSFPTPTEALESAASIASIYQAALKKMSKLDTIRDELKKERESEQLNSSNAATKIEKAKYFARNISDLIHGLGYTQEEIKTLAPPPLAIDSPTEDKDIKAARAAVADFYAKAAECIRLPLKWERHLRRTLNAFSVFSTEVRMGVDRSALDLRIEELYSSESEIYAFPPPRSVIDFLGLPPLIPYRTEDDRVHTPLEFALVNIIEMLKAHPANWCLMDAVRGFFANGGGSCYIVPVEINSKKHDLKGSYEDGTGLAGLEKIRDVSMVAVPDLHLATDTTGAEAASELSPLVTEVVAHCAKMGNRLAIIDPVPGLSAKDAVRFRKNLTLGSRADLATLYYPWVEVPDTDGATRSVPPSGHIAGVWAATDSSHGVFKAPANVSLAGAVSLATPLSDDEQSALNAVGVNCLRSFPGRPLMVWGARTLADPSNRDWKYLNVRRLVCFLADSIHQSTNWAVFQPSDEQLWATLRQSVLAFLNDQWRRGALQGATPDQAYQVICDASNNPQHLIDKGDVHCDIYIAPVRPTEFIHFTIHHTKQTP